MRLVRLMLVTLGLVALVACGGGGGGGESDTGGVADSGTVDSGPADTTQGDTTPPPASPTWDNDIKSLVMSRCSSDGSGNGCHVGSGKFSVSLDAFADTQVPSTCDPTKTVGVMIALKTANTQPTACGVQMPLSPQAPFTIEEQATFDDWVAAGMPEK